MKRLILYPVLFIGFNAFLNAQEVPLIYLENAEWEYYRSGMSESFKFHVHIVKDTTIDQKHYTVFKTNRYRYSNQTYQLIDEIESSKITLIRIEGSKLYRREYTGVDSLLFDASWDVGETITYEAGNPELTYMLEKVDTISTGGVERRQWTFLSSSTEFPGEKGIFVEGIGGMYNPLFSFPIGGPHSRGFEERNSLDCFELNGEIQISEDCEIGTHVSFAQNLAGIKMFPNPASQDLIIQSDLTLQSITICQIFNLSGQIVLTQELKNLNTIICLPEKLSGIYIIEIKNDEFESQNRIIIK